MKLASRFKYGSPSLRSDTPLSDDQIRAVAPSIFAEDKHESRSARYTYVPTIDVVRNLRKEGFEPFMVAQTKVKDEGKREHTKHMLRLRHRGQINGQEANEVILLNSHDGSSGYQMIAGMFRFVCMNGMVCGDIVDEVRVRHSGKIVDQVVQGAFDVIDGFGLVREVTASMKGIALSQPEQTLFAQTALELKYSPTEQKPLPVTPDQVLASHRYADAKPDLWSTFNRIQENLVRGGLAARTALGRRMRTRPVEGIDQNIRLNRALFTLAQGMRDLKVAA